MILINSRWSNLVVAIKTMMDEWNSWASRKDCPCHLTRAGDPFAKLYDKPETKPAQARLPLLHAKTLSSVLEKNLLAGPGDFGHNYFSPLRCL